MKRKSKKRYAITKSYPIPNHPAEYRKTRNGEEIEFVTFTHSPKVDLDKLDKNKPQENHRIIATIELQNNIDIEKNKNSTTEKSHVVPVVYQGKRDLLGRKRNEFKVSGVADTKIVDNIFKTGIRIKIDDKK